MGLLVVIMGIFSLGWGVIYLFGTVDEDLTPVKGIGDYMGGLITIVGSACACVGGAILQKTYGENLTAPISDALSILGQGNIVPGGVLLTASIAAYTMIAAVAAVIIYAWVRFISDRDLDTCWGNLPPFKNNGYESSYKHNKIGRFRSMIFNICFYFSFLVASGSLLAVAIWLLGLIGVFAMGYLVPVSIIVGFVVLTFGSRTVLRLVKVVKSHVANVSIHNPGTLDETGLAAKMKDDKDAARILRKLLKEGKLDDILDR